MAKGPAVVAIVGRPNVGKSTLFNRLVGRRAAIVEDFPGVTRDRNYGMAKYDSYRFLAIDTGGFEPISESNILRQMREQALLAVEEADAIIQLVDAREGLTPADEETYRILSQSKKPLIVAANKADSSRLEEQSVEFYSLGVERFFAISAQHNTGISEMLKELDFWVPLRTRKAPEEDEQIRVSVIGKPNAGKSSLINAMLREERMVVDSVAGTTRDSVDSLCRFHGKDFLLVDTAGIRRKGRISQRVESFSVVSALKAMERAEVAVLVIDATEGVTDQVAHIAGYALERDRALILVVNKWDLVEKDSKTMKLQEQEIRDRLAFLDFAPIVFTSALTHQRVPKVFEAILQVHEQFHRRIQTADLNTVLGLAVSKHPPPSMYGRQTKVYFASQVAVAPPTFVLMTNHPEKTNFAYDRYIVNQFRHHFGFNGSPLKIIWRKRKSHTKPRK
jgi:GTP-binding protein